MTMITDRPRPASRAARFAACYVTMSAAHHVADYWAQTTHQALNKGRHGNVHENAKGRRACLAHGAVYSVGSTVAVCAANKFLNLEASWPGVLTGQLISGGSHYFADRRHTLRALAHRTGRGQFYDSDGSHLLDQSWHLAWLAVAALTTSAITASAGDRGSHAVTPS